MGLNPWALAQIECDECENCECAFQYGGKKPGREDYIRAIRFAETIFTDRAHVHPIPVCHTHERHPLKTTTESVKLKWGEFQAFGTCVYTDAGTHTLNRDEWDEFTVTVPVPAGTQAEDVFVYFTDAPSPVLEWEIRPLSVVINGTNAEISGPGYLFVDPELYKTNTCIERDLDNFVEDVKVYVRSIDPCEAGRYVLSKWPCGSPPCSPAYSGACFTYDNGWTFPSPAECDDDGEFRTYCVSGRPSHVDVSYIAGKPLENGLMNAQDAELIMMLTVANMAVEPKWCPCDHVAQEMWATYRAVPKEPMQENVTGQIKSSIALFDKGMVRALRGLDPRRGNLTAIGQIKTLYPQVRGTRK